MTRDAADRTYRLIGAEALENHEREALIELCRQKIETFLAERGDWFAGFLGPWHHRRQSDGYIPGTLRYEVLKAARFRCELCGIPADEKALEVDHIVPLSHVASHFSLGRGRHNACLKLEQFARVRISVPDGSAPGFNAGFNDLQTVGQAVSHALDHVISLSKNRLPLKLRAAEHTCAHQG